MGRCAVGGASFLPSPLFQSLPPSLSSPLRGWPPSAPQRKPIVSASWRREETRGTFGGDRRVVLLLVGLSAFPLLELRAMAAAAAAVERLEEAHAAENPFVPLLSRIGIIGPAVLGGLYASSLRQKADVESEIKYMNIALDEKDAERVSLEKKLEHELHKEQEEQSERIRKLRGNEAFLRKLLGSAKSKASALQDELRREKRSVRELKLQLDRVCRDVARAGAVKRSLESKILDQSETTDLLRNRSSLLNLEIKDKGQTIDELTSSIAQKQSDSNSLRHLIDQLKIETLESNSTLSDLEAELLATEEELGANRTRMVDLDVRMSSLQAEKDEIDVKVHILRKEFDDVKSSCAETSAFFSELLSEKDGEMELLGDKLRLSLAEEKRSQALVASLERERDVIRGMLEEVTYSLRTLRDELQITQETSTGSKQEVSDLKKRVHNELAEERSALKDLAEDLISVKEVLKSTEDELKAALESNEDLEEELKGIYARIEITGRKLKEEKDVAAGLTQELDVSRKRAQNFSEAKKTLEYDLRESEKTLEEMVEELSSLSAELQDAASENNALESEKEKLRLTLVRKQSLAEAAQENIDDAQRAIEILGTERESLGRKAKRLEEEIASEKGEILRLRRRIELTKGKSAGSSRMVNDPPPTSENSSSLEET
ncbi:unnamed protein product [Spirodela intermedia]|uniref:Uncharacterized protein n=1 Tax=Spirodela intermedia TaxID=51605 RepID=A0A7I8LIS5_SPIIN|nr:unnamed protein product [Spirodela intermedia]